MAQRHALHVERTAEKAFMLTAEGLYESGCELLSYVEREERESERQRETRESERDRRGPQTRGVGEYSQWVRRKTCMNCGRVPIISYRAGPSPSIRL